MGQFDKSVAFQVGTGEATLYFHADGVTHVLVRDTDRECDGYSLPFADEIDPLGRHSPAHHGREITVVRTRLVDGNPDVELVGLDREPGVVHYFTGGDPTQWFTSVPRYAAILYREIYPEIDLKYRQCGDQVKYDFIVRPGGDPSSIQLRYEGMNALAVTPDGHLRSSNHLGFIQEERPYIYQDIVGRRVDVSGRYVLRSSDSFGFEVDAAYDRSQPLIIDPILAYSNYLGGGSEDWGYCVALDGAIPPNVYVAGHTWSDDFPTSGAYADASFGQPFDGFVTKYDPTGKTKLFSTYLGGSANDWVYGVDVDDAGNVYVCGTTSSSDLATSGSYDDVLDGPYDGFIAKLWPSGQVDYITLLGGASYDVCNDIAVDGSGTVYVTGMTYSSSFPGNGDPYEQENNGYWDAFVVKLNSTGSSLDYCRLVGGSGIETSYGIALDVSGCAYITGWTWSPDFEVTAGAYQEIKSGVQDAFVAKLSSGGASLQYCTLFGGSGRDYGSDIAVASGAAYVTGWTSSSSNIATPGAYDESYGGNQDAFVAKLAVDGSDLEYSTYIGDTERDAGYGIAVDNSSRAYVVGRTESPGFDATGVGSASHQGGIDVFLDQLDSYGNTLLFGTCFGSTGDDWGYGVDVWGIDEPSLPVGEAVYVVGKTGSDDLPNSLLSPDPYGGNNDAFLAQFLSEGFQFPISYIDGISPNPADSAASVEFSGHGVDPTSLLSIISHRWESDLDGFLRDQASFSTDSLSVGHHVISYYVQNELGAWSPPVTLAVAGETVWFGGQGYDASGDDIKAYEWTSSLDGELSTLHEFNTNSLSVGMHRIDFRVMDDYHWSNKTSQDVHVTEPVGELWELSWWFPDHPGWFDLQMHDNYACTLYVTNIGQRDQTFNYGVSRSYDMYSVFNVTAGNWWDEDETGDGQLNGSPYNWGVANSSVIAPGETIRYVFSTYNDWNWIPSWQLASWPATAGGFAVSTAQKSAANILTVLQVLENVAAFSVAPLRIEYGYTFLQDAAQNQTGMSQTVWVRGGKITYYWTSLTTAIVASVFTQKAIAAWAIPPWPGPVIAVTLSICEGILIVASSVLYDAALDPDGNFRVYVSPPKLENISCYGTVSGQEESCWKSLSYEAMELYAFAEAGLSSYGKCMGALEADSAAWAGRQMAASFAYMSKANERIAGMNEFVRGFAAGIVPPGDDDIDAIRDSLSGGLPADEQQVLDDFGAVYASEWATWLKDQYDATDWKTLAAQYQTWPDTVAAYTDSMKVIIDSLYFKGTPGVLLGQVVKVSPEVVSMNASPAPTVTLWIEFPALTFDIVECDFVQMSINAGATDEASVNDQTAPLVEDSDDDQVLELKITYTPTLVDTGYRLQSLSGEIITPDGASFPLTFSAAALIKVLAGSTVSRLSGCVLHAGSMVGIQNVPVTVCPDQICAVPVAASTTDSQGLFSFNNLPDASYYLKYHSPEYGDTTYGPVAVVRNDTTRVCMVIGEAVVGCCVGRVGDANGQGGDEPTISDISTLIDALFISGNPGVIDCLAEADVNQSGGSDPRPEDITISDISTLIDYLFITGPETATLSDCL